MRAAIVRRLVVRRWFRSPLAGAVVAQVIVQSTKDAGEIKLTATAAGLTPVTATVNMQHAKPRPLVP